MNEFQKLCPKCGKLQNYSSYDSLRNAARKNTICNPCRGDMSKIKPKDGIWKRICSSCGNEMIYSCRRSYNICEKNNVICRKCANKKNAKIKDISWMRSNDYRQKMSESLKKARKTDSYGDSFKEKCRINRAKNVLNGILNQPQYNKIACEFINNINKKFGWMLVHAENGGEKVINGFFVDGYDKDKNIVFEYDEPKHCTLWQERRDHVKENVIINAINPSKFIRYSEKYGTMYDIINKEVICLSNH